MMNHIFKGPGTPFTRKSRRRNMGAPVKRNILLNPGPATTTDTVKYSQVIPDICPREREFCMLMDDIRNKLVEVVRGDQRYTSILFASSGSGAVEACISSVVPEGKKILIINNGAYGKRMIETARCYYDEDRIIAYELPYGDYPDVHNISKIISDDRDIATLAVVYHETTTGMLNPVEEITRLAHEKSIDVIVDAMSAYAGVPIDVTREEYDYLISSSNKCIQGMAGISFVICRKDKLEKSGRHKRKNLYFNLWDQFRYFEETGQMRYTPPVQIAYALNQALDEYFGETGEMRCKRYTESWETLIAGLRKLNFQFLLPLEQQSKLLTAVIDPQDANYKFEEMHDYLYERGYTIYPGKGAKKDTFRIANIGAINKGDIENFLSVLGEYLKRFNIVV
jgi:2-aminoethylphosphonate aminotransferase